jgi:hypothetical protein
VCLLRRSQHPSRLEPAGFGDDVVRVLALGALAATILLDRIVFWAIPFVAFVEGTGTAVFSRPRPAPSARSCRRVSCRRQRASRRAGQAAVGLAGPPLGGALFGLARALPFLVDARLLRLLDALAYR